MSEKGNSFVTSTTKTFLARLENDLRKNETGFDGVAQFSPLCWLESSFTNYAAEISSYTSLEPNTPYSVLLSTLTSKLASLKTIKTPKPETIKYILILCELIRLCPVHKTSVDVNADLSELMKMRIGNTVRLDPFREIVNDYIERVITLSVVAGSNPVPGLLLANTNTDVISLVHSLRTALHNPPAFRCAFMQLPPHMAALPQARRNEFCSVFYDIIGNFYTLYPEKHHEMLTTSVNQVQMMIDTIIGWKTLNEPAQICLICALIPLCTVALQDCTKNKKSIYASVFKSLSDYKFKKGNDVFYVCMAYLELHCANTHVVNFANKETYKPISEFIRKKLDSFEKTVFNVKDKYVTGRVFNEFLPRYAAVDFASKPQSTALNYLYGLAGTSTGFNPLSKFFNLVTDGYPMKILTPEFHNDSDSQMPSQLITALPAAASTPPNQDAVEVVEATLKFLTNGLMGDAIIFSLTKARGDPVGSWQLTTGMKNFLQKASFMGDKTIASIFSSALTGLVLCQRSTVELIIPFLMIIWGAGEFWKDYPKQDAVSIINAVTDSFHVEALRAVRINSQALDSIPAIFLCFLRWAESILLRKSGKKEKKIKLLAGTRLSWHQILVYLRGAIGESRALDLCDAVITRILAAYEFEPLPRYPFDGSLTATDSLTQPVITNLIHVWFGWVQAALTASRSTEMLAVITKPREEVATFAPSLKRIATLTQYIARFVTNDSCIKNGGEDLGPQAEHFYGAMFKLIVVMTRAEPALDKAFVNIHPTATEYFIKCIASQAMNMLGESKFSNRAMWLNITFIIASRFECTNLSDNELAMLERTLPVCLAPHQFLIYDEKHRLEFVSALTVLIKSFISNRSNTSPPIRTTLLVTVCDALMVYLDKKNSGYSDAVIEQMMGVFPILVHGHVFGRGPTDTPYPDIEVERRRTHDIFYVLHVMNTVLKHIQTPDIVNNVHDTLLEMLAANPGVAWRHFVVVSHTVEPIFQIQIVDSFTEFLGMKFFIVSPIPAGDIKAIQKLYPDQIPSEPKTEEDKKKKAEFERLTQSLALYSRYIRKKTNLTFKQEEGVKLHEQICANNYSFLINPPIMNTTLVAAAIKVVGAAGQLTDMFEGVTRQFVQQGKNLNQQFTLFYTAFFRVMAEGWTPRTPVFHALNKHVSQFLDDMQQTEQFAHYFVHFSKLVQSRDICKKLYTDCFLRPFLKCPMDYRILGSLPKFDVEAFIKLVSSSPEYDTLIDSMLLSEPIFAHYNPQFVDSAREIVMTVLAEHHSPTLVLDTVNADTTAPLSDLSSSRLHRWIAPCGNRADGTAVIAIDTSRIPDVSPAAIAWNFVAALPQAGNFELVVAMNKVGAFIKKKFADFIAALPEGTNARINKIYVTNVAMTALQLLKDFDFTPVQEKLSVVPDVTRIYCTEDKGVCLPMWARPHSEFARAYAKAVPPSGTNCLFKVYDTKFRLLTQATVFGQNAPLTNDIEFEDIISVTDEGDNLIIQINDGGTARYIKLKTQLPGIFENSYLCMEHYCKYQPPCTAAEVDLKGGDSLRSECIAMALHLLSRKSKSLVAPALQLFVASIRNCSLAPEVFNPCSEISTYRRLFHELQEAGLVMQVVPPLAQYFRYTKPENCSVLIPLLEQFFNNEQNTEKLGAVMRDILPVLTTDTACSQFLHYLWPKISSTTAIDIIASLLLKSEVVAEQVAAIFVVFVENYPAYMGKLLIDRYLDGTIRRNSFGSELRPSRIFETLRTLAFEKPDFVKDSVAPLVFGCVFGAVHSDQKEVENIRTILTCAFTTLASMAPDRSTAMLMQNQNIQGILKRPREMAVSALVNAGDDLCGSYSEQDRAKYREYINSTNPCENKDMWYIKAAAMVQMGTNDVSFVKKFESILPHLFKLPLGHLRLELCFDAMSTLIENVPPSALDPLFLFWPAIVAAQHINVYLRRSALKLLGKCILFGSKNGGFRNIAGFETTAYITHKLTVTRSIFGQALGSAVTTDFTYLMACALSRGFEEAETRDEATEVARICIQSLKERPYLASHFVLPLIAYTRLDITKECECFTQKQGIPAILFENFENRREEDALFIVAYLADVFASRFCMQSTSRIAECLIYGAIHLSAFFRPIMRTIVDKCWYMVDIENKPELIDTFATVSAHFMTIPDSGVDYSDVCDKFKFLRPSDVDIQKLIHKSLTGVMESIKLVS